MYGGLSPPFDQQMTLSPKILSPNFGWGLSPTFDQQVTLSPKHLSQLWMGGCLCLLISKWHGVQKNLSPNIRYGGVTTLAQNTSSFWEVSPPRQRHLVLMRCYLLTIQVGNERIAVRSLLYIHNSKKHRFQIWMGVVSTFWSACDTESQNLKSQLWMGVVSAFWSANDTESKCLHLSPNIRYGGVTTLAQNTCSFQQVSPPRQRHLVLMRGCYLLTIQVGKWKNCCEKPAIYT